MATPQPRNKDSMRSTWRLDKKNWTLDHHMFNALNLFHANLDQDVPVHAKSDAMPYLTAWSCHRWILMHALWPIAVQWMWIYLTGQNLSPFAAFFLYLFAYQSNAIFQIQVLRGFGHKYGFLDGDKHARDQIPDVGVGKALNSLILTTFSRPLYFILLSYKANEVPHVSWWLPVELALHSVVLDFFFYTYHRACHEVNTLWQFHRTHHLTKHPNPMLSGYSDAVQEIIEIAIVPLLTCATLKMIGLPMGFYDWWICHEYLVFSEAFGHSGLRVYAIVPSIAQWALKAADCELVIEDHDLHHRNGWRKSHNYGKQTRVWDRVFGTCGPRYETDVVNVDWNQRVNMPWFGLPWILK